MAHVLSENERAVTAAALQAYADKLKTADATGIPEVDRLVSEREAIAESLAAEAVGARRISFTTSD